MDTVDVPRLPLLERLGPNGHGRLLDAAALRDSVGQELVRLLNTRTGPSERAVLTVVDYGIPDWSSAYGADVDDRRRLARGIERAVAAFEPRLLAPSVQVLPHPAGLRQLQVVLSGRLRGEGAAQQVRYAIALGAAGAALAPVEAPA